jgi:hypothetical protein
MKEQKKKYSSLFVIEKWQFAACLILAAAWGIVLEKAVHIIYILFTK